LDIGPFIDQAKKGIDVCGMIRGSSGNYPHLQVSSLAIVLLLKAVLELPILGPDGKAGGIISLPLPTDAVSPFGGHRR